MADRPAAAGGAGAAPNEPVNWQWQIAKACIFYFGIQAVMGRE